MKNSLRFQWFYQKRIYVLIFFIPVIIMALSYAVFGVHPFGDESALVLDLNGQYVYYYEYIKDAIFGSNSLIYSWSRNLSGEMFGIIGYYLASPFILIPVLLPRSMMMYSVEIMELLKLGTCAVTFAVYLRNRQKTKTYTMVIFSVMYALSSYAIVNLMNPMWIDGLIYLPLILMGVEKLIDNGNKLGLIIPLALLFLANFYIGYMVGIFTAFYFVYYFFKKEDMLSGKETVKAILRFALCAAVAVMCAMIVLLPIWNSLKLGKLDFTKANFNYKAQFTYVQFLSKLLPMSYDTVRPEGLPFIYCGALTLILVPLYFMNRNIKTKSKICNGVLLALMVVIMYIRPIDICMHGFQMPNWLPFRYSFVFSFLLLVMAANVFEHLEGITYKEISGTFVALIAFVIYLENKRFDHLFTLGAILVSLICFCVYYGMLVAIKKRNSQTVHIVTVLLVCLELFVTTVYTIVSIDSDVVYSRYSSYKPYVENGRDVMKEINSKDNGLFRTEKTFMRTVNDPMAFGMRGVSHSSSTMNSPVIKFLKDVGFSSKGHATCYNGHTKLTDSFLGIKYIMSKDKDVYDYDKYLKKHDINVYKNDNALSVGFMVDKSMKSLYLGGGNPFVNQNKLYSAISHTQQEDYFKQISQFNTVYNNVTVNFAGNNIKYVPTQEGAEASIEFSFVAPTDDIIYAFFPSDYERKMHVEVNGKDKGTYFESDYYSIIELGKFQPFENVTVTMTLDKDEAYMIAQYFYYLDDKMFEQAVDNAKQNEWEITSYSDTYIKGNITAKENQVMMTTIPYENGWTITVDGKKVKPVKLAQSFIGVELEPGEHVVTMKFKPDYFIKGMFISIAGIIIVIVLGIIDKHRSNILLKRLYK